MNLTSLIEGEFGDKPQAERSRCLQTPRTFRLNTKRTEADIIFGKSKLVFQCFTCSVRGHTWCEHLQRQE